MEIEDLIPRKKRKRRTIALVIIHLIIICILVFFYKTNLASSCKNLTISPLPDNEGFILSAFHQLMDQEKNPKDLETKIKKTVGSSLKNYSVLVVDFNSNFRMDIAGNMMYTAASVNKIPILAALYYKNHNGEVDMDNSITLQESDIQDYGTGIIRYEPAGSTYSVKTLARLMMEKSDNTAAFLIANYVVGNDEIMRLIKEWGMTQTSMSDNKTSNSDMAILMEKIFRGNISSPADTKEMLSMMENTDFEDRLPALLPKSASTYHKIGSEIGIIHDVGIVVDGPMKYYIGIFTSDVTDEPKITHLLALISKSVYDFMKQ